MTRADEIRAAHARHWDNVKPGACLECDLAREVIEARVEMYAAKVHMADAEGARDALRRLPVIARCDQCTDATYVWAGKSVCESEAVKDAALPSRAIVQDAPPPEWCPLRGAR